MSRSIDLDSLYQGLVFSLPMEEGSGTATVKDVAKAHHPVTQTHAPVWTALPSGIYCMDFDGANDWLQCAAASCADLDFVAGAFSGGLWVYPTSVTSRNVISRGADVTAPVSGWWMDISAGNNLRFYTSQLGVAQYSYGSVSGCVNQWQLWGWSRSGASVRIMLNGCDITSSVGTHINPASSANDLLIGHASGGAGKLIGKLWNPRIWSRALALSEHREIFNGERFLFGV